MAIRMLFLYITYFSYRCFYSFSMNQKRIVLFTLFCLLKNKNNGNFTVSIHKVHIVVSLIVRIVNFRFRFKCEIHISSGDTYPLTTIRCRYRIREPQVWKSGNKYSSRITEWSRTGYLAAGAPLGCGMRCLSFGSALMRLSSSWIIRFTSSRIRS